MTSLPKGFKKPHIYPYPGYPGYWMTTWQTWFRVGTFLEVCRMAKEHWENRPIDPPDVSQKYDFIDGVPVRYRQ